MGQIRWVGIRVSIRWFAIGWVGIGWVGIGCVGFGGIKVGRTCLGGIHIGIVVGGVATWGRGLLAIWVRRVGTLLPGSGLEHAATKRRSNKLNAL